MRTCELKTKCREYLGNIPLATFSTKRAEVITWEGRHDFHVFRIECMSASSRVSGVPAVLISVSPPVSASQLRKQFVTKRTSAQRCYSRIFHCHLHCIFHSCRMTKWSNLSNEISGLQPPAVRILWTYVMRRISTGVSSSRLSQRWRMCVQVVSCCVQ
jgi:hypothetical protein